MVETALAPCNWYYNHNNTRIMLGSCWNEKHQHRQQVGTWARISAYTRERGERVDSTAQTRAFTLLDRTNKTHPFAYTQCCVHDEAMIINRIWMPKRLKKNIVSMHTWLVAFYDMWRFVMRPRWYTRWWHLVWFAFFSPFFIWIALWPFEETASGSYL